MKIIHNKKKVTSFSKKKIEAHHTAMDLKERLESGVINKIESKICHHYFKILLVDDCPDILEIYSTSISEECKFDNIKIADDGDTALEILKKEKDIDVVLSDYRMPRMDGYKLYLASRELENPPTFFIITGFDDYEIKALKKEQILVFPKPLKMDDIKKVLDGFYLKKLEWIDDGHLKLV